MPVDKMRFLPSQGVVRSPGKNVAGVCGLGVTVGKSVGLVEIEGAFDAVGECVGLTVVGDCVTGEPLGDFVKSKLQTALSHVPGLQLFT